MSDYVVKAKDSAGNEFQLASAGEAIRLLAILNNVAKRELPVRDIVIEAPDGTVIDHAELKRLATEEVHGLALERVGRKHVPGRPPGL